MRVHASGGEILHTGSLPRPRRGLGPLRDKFERGAVRGAHDREVALVQGRERRRVQPFADGDNRRVDETEPERLVGLDQRR